MLFSLNEFDISYNSNDLYQEHQLEVYQRKINSDETHPNVLHINFDNRFASEDKFFQHKLHCLEDDLRYYSQYTKFLSRNNNLVCSTNYFKNYDNFLSFSNLETVFINQNFSLHYSSLNNYALEEEFSRKEYGLIFSYLSNMFEIKLSNDSFLWFSEDFGTGNRRNNLYSPDDLYQQEIISKEKYFIDTDNSISNLDLSDIKSQKESPKMNVALDNASYLVLTDNKISDEQVDLVSKNKQIKPTINNLINDYSIVKKFIKNVYNISYLSFGLSTRINSFSLLSLNFKIPINDSLLLDEFFCKIGIYLYF